MNRSALMMGLASFIFCLLSSGLCPPSLAVWIWDPKTGKWSNPKYEVKGSAKAQFQHAEAFEKNGKWERSAKEFKKLVRAYPTSPLAPEALVRSAEAYKKVNFYYEAYQAYQMLVEKYPSYPRIQKIIEEEYRIGNLFLSGKKRKLKIIKLALFPSREIAAEIFKTVVQNYPFGDLADDAQLRVGIAYEKMKKYPEAMEAYQKLLKDYPASDLRDEAKYRMGLAPYKQSRGAAYDQSAMDRALEIFNEFLKEYPKSRRAEEVRTKIDELKNRKAQGLFQIAAYYDKVGDDRSATVYYEQILAGYPQSREARLAQRRMEALRSDKIDSKKGS